MGFQKICNGIITLYDSKMMIIFVLHQRCTSILIQQMQKKQFALTVYSIKIASFFTYFIFSSKLFVIYPNEFDIP